MNKSLRMGPAYLTYAATVHKVRLAREATPQLKFSPAFLGAKLQMNHSALVSSLLSCLCSSHASAPLIPLLLSCLCSSHASAPLMPLLLSCHCCSLPLLF